MTRTIDDPVEFEAALKQKLLEEAREGADTRDAAGLLQELSDVLEVVYALAEHAGFTPETLEAARRSRAAERGAFTHRIWLEETHPQA